MMKTDASRTAYVLGPIDIAKEAGVLIGYAAIGHANEVFGASIVRAAA